MASIFRTTVEHQLQNGGMTTPQNTNVGLPNPHDFLPDIADEIPILAAQAKYMGGNNQYRSSYASDIVCTMGIGAGAENTNYLVNQNATFPMFNHCVYYRGPEDANEASLHDASGIGLAQHQSGQIPYNHTSFTEMLLLQHAKPTMQPGIHEEPNPLSAYGDGYSSIPLRVEYPSEEDLEGLTPMENGFGYMPTIPEDGLYPRIPYIDQKYQQTKKAQLLLQNQSMNPDTRIVEYCELTSSQKGHQHETLDAGGMYERGEPSVPRGAWVDRKLLSPTLPPESLVLHQGHSNVLPRVAELPGFESLYDQRYDQMGLPCDPHIRLLLARHHGASGQRHDGDSSIHNP